MVRWMGVLCRVRGGVTIGPLVLVEGMQYILWMDQKVRGRVYHLTRRHPSTCVLGHDL